MKTQREYNYSAIQTAYTCQKKYKLLYVDKLAPEGAHSMDLSFGSALHAGVEAYLRGEDGFQVFDLYWQGEIQKALKRGRYSPEELGDQGKTLLARFERLHLKKFEVFKLEEKIQVEIAGVRLFGTPDFIGDYEGVEAVVDFKTTSYPYEMERLLSNEQLPLYAEMARRVYGFEAKEIIYFPFVKGPEPRIQRPLRLAVTPEHTQAVLTNVLDVCRDLDTRTRFHESRSACVGPFGVCDFFNVCHKRKT